MVIIALLYICLARRSLLPERIPERQARRHVKLAFANRPGHIYKTTIGDVVQGVGQGQIAVSGILARAETIGTSTDYPALVNMPADMDRNMLRLGMVGSATVISDDAGPIGILASILLWVIAYVLYL
jgi:hypothetical protein